MISTVVKHSQDSKNFLLLTKYYKRKEEEIQRGQVCRGQSFPLPVIFA